MKAARNNSVIAESDDTVLVEGAHFFLEHTLKVEYVTISNNTSTFPCKGKAQ